MGFFDVEYDVLRVQLLPVRLRKAVHKAWIQCLIAPVVYLYSLYMLFRTAKLYDLAHNSQICYMEAAFNDAFDNTLRRIYIGDGEYIDPVYLYTIPEELEVPLALESELPVMAYDAPAWLYTEPETYAVSVQFVVYYPADLTDIPADMPRFRAVVDKYRLASKYNYTVEDF